MKASKTEVVAFNEDDWKITLIKPSSSEYSGKYIVVFEDAYGSVSKDIQTAGEICAQYGINCREFEDI
jgi:hypothetical protein